MTWLKYNDMVIPVTLELSVHKKGNMEHTTNIINKARKNSTLIVDSETDTFEITDAVIENHAIGYIISGNVEKW